MKTEIEEHEAKRERLIREADRAEATLLGALLVMPENLPIVVSVVTAADFRLERHREVFAAISALDESSQVVDVLTVKRQLVAMGARCTVPELSALMDGIPHATNAEAYAGIVAEAATLRRVEAAAREVVEACWSSDTAEEVLTRAQSVMLAIGANRSKGKGLEPFREALKEAQAELQAASETGHAGGLSYGLKDLDVLTGGLHAGELIVIGGRPGEGKSALAFHVARSVAKAADSGPVALFSLEMARASVALRLLGAEGMVDTTAAKTGSASEASWAALLRAMAEAMKWPLWVDDAGTISVVEIAARCRRLKADKGLSLVLVDYLQLIRGTRAENRTQEIGAISRGLKQLAKDLAVPLVALAQLNRSADGVRPMLSHLRESGDIEADADAVLLLHRTDEDDDSAVEIIIAKQRNGPTGAVPVYFRRECQRFESAAKNEDGGWFEK